MCNDFFRNNKSNICDGLDTLFYDLKITVTFTRTASQSTAFDLMLKAKMLIKVGITVENKQNKEDLAKGCGVETG